jgi:long-chain acyl-CoA synthetase
MDFRAVSVIRDHALARPDAPAVTGDGRTLTYAEVHARSSRLAGALLEAGLSRGSRVVYLGKNAPEFFDVLFGALKIGAVATPINWRLTPEEIAAIARDAMPAGGVVVLDAEFAAMADRFGGATVVVTGAPFEAWLSSHPAVDPGFQGTETDVVIQLYTSGTTGLPKGVQLTNANFVPRESRTEDWRMDDTSVSAVPMPLFHIGGSGWAFMGFATGAHNVLVRDFDPAAFVDLLETMRITNTFLVPAALQFMCAVPGAAERDYSTLRSITYGASPITTDVLRRVLDTFHAPLIQLYGMTETTGVIVQLDATDHHGPLMRSAGRPYPWIEIKIVGPGGDKELPAGQVGEVWTRSAQNTPGYWHRPGDDEALLTDDGWLRTGDAGYLDEDGYLYLTDRIKDMIVTGGENVYPIEVEEVLAGHPGVADVGVIGVPDAAWGETVKAIVVRAPDATTTEKELLGYARERLAGFKRPHSVDFVDALPRNPSGKILKKELRKPYWTGRDRSIS